MEWSSLKGGLVADGPAYLSLIKSFRELGRYEDADSCYYHYRRWRQDGPEPLWSKITDIVAWLSCGYGVRPSFTLAWCFGLMGFFALLFWLGGGICLTAAWDHEGAAPAAWSPSHILAPPSSWRLRAEISLEGILARIQGLVQQAYGVDGGWCVSSRRLHI